MKILHGLILLVSAVATLRGARRRLLNEASQLGDDVIGEDVLGGGRTKSGGPGNAGVVALSGSGRRLAIGAPKNDGPPKEGPQNPLLPPDLAHGSVRVLQFMDNEFWLQIGPDIDGNPDEEMGFAVALNGGGHVLAVGGLGIDVDATPGLVRVFQLVVFQGESEFSWAQVGDDLTGDKDGERFGSALALSDEGDVLAVGVPNSGKRLGHVSVYARSGGRTFSDETWDQMGGDIDGESEDDRAGFALDLSADGRVVAVGARFSSGNGAFSGHVRVFSFEEDDEWTQLGEDIDGNAALDKSGRSVSLSEDGRRVAIGAVDARNDASAMAGHVRVFEFSDNAWKQLGDDIDGLFDGDEAGTSVALSAAGDVCAVGAPGAGRGEVRIFAFDGAKNWYQLNEDLEGDKRGDRFGETISLSQDGKTLAVGSLLADGGRGVAKVFALDEPADQTPEPSQKPTPAPVPGPDETPPPSPKPSARPSRDPTAAPTDPPADGAARLAPAALLLAAAALL